MNARLLSLRIALCIALIHASATLYDLVNRAAHTLIRLAGRISARADGYLFQRWAELRTRQGALSPDDAPPREETLGDKVLAAVVRFMAGVCAVLWLNDLVPSYTSLLVAAWSGAGQ